MELILMIITMKKLKQRETKYERKTEIPRSLSKFFSILVLLLSDSREEAKRFRVNDVLQFFVLVEVSVIFFLRSVNLFCMIHVYI